jgi:hypothetical protein
MLELSLEKSHSKKGWGTRQAGSSRGQVSEPCAVRDSSFHKVRTGSL